jgi:hypothetical protein
MITGKGLSWDFLPDDALTKDQLIDIKIRDKVLLFNCSIINTL